MKTALVSSPPHSAVLPPEDVCAGRKLTEGLVALAAEHFREYGASIPTTRRDAIIVAALVTTLASVAAAVARAHRFDVEGYKEFLLGYVARVFDVESQRPVYDQ